MRATTRTQLQSVKFNYERRVRARRGCGRGKHRNTRKKILSIISTAAYEYCVLYEYSARLLKSMVRIFIARWIRNYTEIRRAAAAATTNGGGRARGKMSPFLTKIIFVRSARARDLNNDIQRR